MNERRCTGSPSHKTKVIAQQTRMLQPHSQDEPVKGVKKLKDTRRSRTASFERAKSDPSLRATGIYKPSRRLSSPRLDAENTRALPKRYQRKPKRSRAKTEPTLLSSAVTTTDLRLRMAKNSRDFAAPVCSASNVAMPNRRHSFELDEEVANSICLGCDQKDINDDFDLPKLAGTQPTAVETEKVAKLLAEALETMGLFDEDEEQRGNDLNDPLSLDSSGHSQGYRR